VEWPAGYPDETLIPSFPPLDDPSVVTLDYFRDLPYDFVTLIENAIDVAHVPFTHAGTLSSRAKGIPLALKLDAPASPAGFNGTQIGTPEGLTKKTQFHAPIRWHQYSETPFFKFWILSYAVPIVPGRSRVNTRFILKTGADADAADAEIDAVDAGSDGTTKKKGGGGPLAKVVPWLVGLVLKTRLVLLPQWMLHIGQGLTTDDDNIFLNHQERRVTMEGRGWARSYYLPTRSDLYVSQFRRWMDRFGDGGPFTAAEIERDLGRISLATPQQLTDR
ncbi:unnamed protein product, partial [Phaeothamnion confervicola]